MATPVRWCVDFPASGSLIDKPQTLVRGWVSADATSHVGRIWLSIDTEEVPFLHVPRSDVAQALPDENTTGFQGTLPLDALINGEACQIKVEIDENILSIPLDLAVDLDAARVFAESKRKKLHTIYEILRCPSCNAGELGRIDGELVCSGCGSHYAFDHRRYDFLTDDLRTLGAVESTESISANPYDEVAVAIIADRAEGLVLDAGSGLRSDYYPNVINFEIADYATTDVLGVCERLPFRDDSFEAVFSFAVLEHVRDPFQAAREITRVLKPGGTLYAAVPFLQPFHGYPSHYYNMTSSGLRNLFPTLIHETVDVPTYGLPIWALVWILKSWMGGLPPDDAKDFGEMRVRDLVGDVSGYLDQRFVMALPAKVNEELACVNRLVARKPLP